MHRQTFKTTLSEGGGEGKHICDYDCVSIPGKEEISTRFWFVSTSFVRGCGINLESKRLRFWARLFNGFCDRNFDFTFHVRTNQC